MVPNLTESEEKNLLISSAFFTVRSAVILLNTISVELSNSILNRPGLRQPTPKWIRKIHSMYRIHCRTKLKCFLK